MNRIFLIFILVIIGPGCFAQRNVELPLPSVPSDLRQPSERAAYIMLHFWDAMDWNDTTLTRSDQFMEQNSANFYSLFGLTDSISESKAVEQMLAGASVDKRAYARIAEIAGIYLYEPSSPVADDEAYAVVVDCLLKDRKLGEADLLRLEDTHRSLMRNRVGSKAADFEFVDRDGNCGRLSDAVSDKNYTLLVFYDPDCHDCAEMERYLASSPLLNEKSIGVLMMSPYGEQDGLWLRHAATMPAEWRVARPADDDFEDSDLYDIRATPTVYLLDRAGMVVAKNITLEKIGILEKL